MIKEYAIEKDIPVQIPSVIRRSSYNGYRITEESSPENTSRQSYEKGTPRTNKKNKQKNKKKSRSYSLKQRINT